MSESTKVETVPSDTVVRSDNNNKPSTSRRAVNKEGDNRSRSSDNISRKRSRSRSLSGPEDIADYHSRKQHKRYVKQI